MRTTSSPSSRATILPTTMHLLTVSSILLSVVIYSSDAFVVVASQTTFRSSSLHSTTTTTTTATPISVALTREEGKNDKLRSELEARSTSTCLQLQLNELPCIAHADGEDSGKLASTLRQQPWDYVVITSPEAAKVLSTAWLGAEGAPDVAVVGQATQEALEELGIPVAFCPSKATASTLVKELPSKNGPGTTVLYPASAKAATTLQEGLLARGFSVTRLNTYDTITATWSEEEQAMASTTQIACFGSPSAVEAWLQNTNNNKNVLAACIGETSADACRKLDFSEEHIFYPEKPGVPGWASAVMEAMESLQVAHE